MRGGADVGVKRQVRRPPVRVLPLRRLQPALKTNKQTNKQWGLTMTPDRAPKKKKKKFTRCVYL